MVDGHNLLFQMFYGMPARIVNSRGIPIHAVIGFIGALAKVIKAVGPTHAVVIFDGESGSHRTQIDAGYKANRTDYSDAAPEENPFAQLEPIKKVLEWMDIRHHETGDGIEADDMIAGFARACAGVMQCVILSQDTDFIQLVNENVSLFRYRGKRTVLYDEAMVKERYGLAPGQMADYKVLVGDPSDNIKGVPGIGAKTAVRLLTEYGGLDHLMQNLTYIRPPSIREALIKHSDRIERNVALIHLKRTVRLPFEMKDTVYPGLPEQFATMAAIQAAGLA